MKNKEIVYIDIEKLHPHDKNPRKVLRKVLPKTRNANATDSCKCPECKRSLNVKYKYKCCPYCGQALDWGDEE